MRGDFEHDLDALLRAVEGAGDGADARRRAVDAIGHIASRLDADRGDDARQDELRPTVRELLSTDYYAHQWGRIGMLSRSVHVDDFGHDPIYEQRMQGLLDRVYERYFRVEVAGLAHVADEGAALLVCNHGGVLPVDGLMLRVAFRRNHARRRAPRWLVEDHAFHAPFLGPVLNRLGAVRACQENAEALLSRGELLAVFPEGVQGIGKPHKERYQLRRFGRGGHVKLALRTGVPLVPIAIVGAEDSYPLLYKLGMFSRAVSLPFIPVTPTFPLLGPLGLLPLPSRWRIEVGEPIAELSEHGPEAADDPVVVQELNDRVREAVQVLLDRALAARGERVYALGP